MFKWKAQEPNWHSCHCPRVISPQNDINYQTLYFIPFQNFKFLISPEHCNLRASTNKKEEEEEEEEEGNTRRRCCFSSGSKHILSDQVHVAFNLFMEDLNQNPLETHYIKHKSPYTFLNSNWSTSKSETQTHNLNQISISAYYGIPLQYMKKHLCVCRLIS